MEKTEVMVKVAGDSLQKRALLAAPRDPNLKKHFREGVP
jgi:hypothetical protein